MGKKKNTNTEAENVITVETVVGREETNISEPTSPPEKTNNLRPFQGSLRLKLS